MFLFGCSSSHDHVINELFPSRFTITLRYVFIEPRHKYDATVYGCSGFRIMWYTGHREVITHNRCEKLRIRRTKYLQMEVAQNHEARRFGLGFSIKNSMYSKVYNRMSCVSIRAPACAVSLGSMQIPGKLNDRVHVHSSGGCCLILVVTFDQTLVFWLSWQCELWYIVIDSDV